MKLRVISLLLAIAITILLIPGPVCAATVKSTELEAQVRSTYRSALHCFGKGSFNGYCGSLVNWQTYLLGIDTQKYGSDGKDAYDLYSKLGTTTGGYRVKCYPASQYDLRTALNFITHNGTVDAYNLVVGFQKTNTREGSIYGHAVFVHGIVEGVVYFAECYSTSLGGRYWAEGEPIYCSIDTFCDYYNSWTVFDGVAYFGLKNYADICGEYPASMYAMVVGDTATYSEPADPGIYAGSLSDHPVIAGEVVKVTSLLETPGGKYWYSIDRNGVTEYIAPEKVVKVADCYDDLGVANPRMPSVIRKGNGFVLRGAVFSANSWIRRVTVTVYDPTIGMVEPVMQAQLEVDGKSVDLNTWQLDRYMTFRQMNTGTYRIAITAEVESYMLKDGTAVMDSNTVMVWNSEFRVVTDWKQYPTVTFDGNGGESQLFQTVNAYGTGVETLPEATRAGYTLAGWSLDPAGEQMITSEYEIAQNVTLYAQWRADSEGLSGWQLVDGLWHYYLDGVSVGEGISSEETDKNVIENWQTPRGALLAAGTALYEATP